MKATITKTTAIRLVLVLLMVSFQSCGTYNTKTSDIESKLFNGNFDGAISSLDQNKFLKKKRNKLLYLMEKGKVEHMRGNYKVSNDLLEQAYILIEDRIKTNAGQAIASKFTNPMATPYKGEDFEKVTIFYYKALNYFNLGMPYEALVEAKRINLKLYEINEQYKNNKNKYSEDAFSQILQGLIYESVRDINNAFIAYRNAEEIYTKNNGSFFGVVIPNQLKKDLMRTALQMGFMQEFQQYQNKYGFSKEEILASKNTTDGEAILFWENGIGPAKDQIVITASGGGGIFYGSYMDGDIMEEIIIPIPLGADIGNVNAIAIPKYRERGGYYSKAEVIANGKPHQLELAQDFYPIAKQTLKDRMLRETIDLVTRFAAKKAASAGLGALGKELLGDTGGDLVKLGADITGAATEKADTRNWQSLPATISYTRIPLKQGENKFVIKKYGEMGVDTDTITIPYKKGLQIIDYFDVGRTQVIPNVKAAKTDDNSLNTPVQQNKKTVLVAPTKKEKVWKNAGDGILYRIENTKAVEQGETVFVKNIELKTTKPQTVKVTYTITEQPLKEVLKEVKEDEYYDFMKKGKNGVADKYFTITQEVKPEEVVTYKITQYKPESYITIFKTE